MWRKVHRSIQHSTNHGQQRHKGSLTRQAKDTPHKGGLVRQQPLSKTGRDMTPLTRQQNDTSRNSSSVRKLSLHYNADVTNSSGPGHSVETERRNINQTTS